MPDKNGQIEEMVQEVSSKMTLSGLALYTQALRSLQAVSDIVPAWWSPARDQALEAIAVSYDHLDGLLFSATTKLVNIPLKFVPRNPEISAHQDLAVRFTEQVQAFSGWSEGFRKEYKMALRDYLGQDNGMFLGIMSDDPFDWDDPLQTMPLGIRHLDSQFVTRTGDPLYPITYDDPEFGGRWAYHRSRVIMLSQGPSSRKTRLGVGHSAMGRSVRLGQVLNDQLVYKMERMGSRPTSEILALEGGEAADIIKSMMMSKEMMDNLGLTRFAMAVAMGIPLGGKLNHIRLNDFDLFNEEVGTEMAMYSLAYFWGLDPRDIWPLQGSKEGNQVSNMQARGKLPADFTADMKEQMDQKFCPAVLEAVYDYQDDEEDQAHALNSDIRARRRERNAKSGLIDKEAERRMMILDGDLTREEFIRMQLESGKLEDGTPIATLFYSSDPLIGSLLAIPDITSPLLFSQNDADTVLEAIEEKKVECYQVLAAGGRRNHAAGTKALAALAWLEEQYDAPPDPPVPIQTSTTQASTMEDIADAVNGQVDDEEE